MTKEVAVCVAVTVGVGGLTVTLCVAVTVCVGPGTLTVLVGPGTLTILVTVGPGGPGILMGGSVIVTTGRLIGGTEIVAKSLLLAPTLELLLLKATGIITPNINNNTRDIAMRLPMPLLYPDFTLLQLYCLRQSIVFFQVATQVGRGGIVPGVGASTRKWDDVVDSRCAPVRAPVSFIYLGLAYIAYPPM